MTATQFRRVLRVRRTGAVTGVLVVALAASASGLTFTPVLSAKPADFQNSPTITNVRATACPDATHCVAVGSYHSNHNVSKALIEVQTPSGFVAVAPPLPPGFLPTEYSSLQAVSCPAPGECVAVGQRQAISSNSATQAPYLVVEHLGAWHYAATPVPSDKIATPLYQYLSSVSCPAVGQCVAVGEYQVASGSDKALIEMQNASGFHPVTSPLPGDASTTPGTYGNYFMSVDCAAVGHCAATGTYTDHGGAQRVLINVLSPSGWRAVHAPVDADMNFAGQFQIGDVVSCPAVGACTIVGGFGFSGQYMYFAGYQQGPNGFTTKTLPMPANADLDATGPIMKGLDCTAPGDCVAVAWYKDTTPVRLAVVETEVRGTWSAQQLAWPSNATPSQYDGTLTSISCVTFEICAATAGYPTGPYDQSVIATDIQGTWTTHATTFPTAQAPTQGEYLDTTACAPNGACLVGGYLLHVGVELPALERVTLPTAWHSMVRSFAFGSAQLTTALKTQVAQIAHHIADGHLGTVSVVGYSDNLQGPGAAQLVSQQRATAVANLLKSDLTALHAGIVTITVSWHGAGNPVATNSTAAGRALNRRVEVAFH